MPAGLKDICIDAAIGLLGDEENMSPDKAKAIKKFGERLSEGIITWLTRQTFTITDMKAALRVESIKTQGPLQADVLPTVTIASGIPVVASTAGWIGIGSTTGPGAVLQGSKGVLIPKIDLNYTGAQGGLLTTSGYAYIGANPTGETNEMTTKVKLLRSRVVHE